MPAVKEIEHRIVENGYIDTPNNEYYPVVSKEYNSALIQLGTLGGGNHFIEIQKDNDDNIWIMIHSGSRNLGYKVAQHYNKIAIDLNTKWHSQVPKKWDLAFLPIETQEAKAYLREMQYCVDFALANRKLMMNTILDCFQSYMLTPLTSDEMINIAHNYAVWENHYGKDVIIHRKGATLAREGTIGIIPGSQGTKSYIVRGLGNPESFMSCSHGAGRKMSRAKAKEVLTIESQQEIMDKQGIIHGIRNRDNLDEAPGAYKDISEVMDNQKDLVEIITELSPLAVIKGD
jgi:tRNA-splicing ligase RtcB